MEKLIKDFNENGIAVMPGFASEAECDAMIAEMKKIVDQTDMSQHLKEKFRCLDEGEAKADMLKRNNYFMTSGDKIRFFFDPQAYNEDNELIDEPFKSLNKVGHALHMEPGPFHDIVTSDKSKAILKALNYTNVAVPQSMYIFKQAKIGSAVTPHQDSTFLHTEPKQTVIGFWVALENATEDNGCLWSVPGSHKPYKNEPKVNKPDHAFMFRDGKGGTEMRLGKTPEYYAQQDYKWIPHQVRKGDLVLIHDMVLHKSLPNHSVKSRNIFAWHLYDCANSKWSETCWLQYPNDKPFMTFET